MQFLEHAEYKRNKKIWLKCRDCYDGEEAIKGRAGNGSDWEGSMYLQSLPGQSKEEYERYRDRAVFYNGFGRSVDALQGMIFSKPIVYSDFVVETIAAQLDDITKTGLSLGDLASSIAEEQLVIGRCGILIDFDRMEEEAMMRDAAEALNLRPFWTMYFAEQIIYWETGWIENETRISQVVLRESEELIRELALGDGFYYQQMYIPNPNNRSEWVPDGDEIIPTVGGEPLREIPFKFVGVKNNQPAVAKPPLLDMATLNVSHYRNSADYENGLHLTGTPTPYFFGIDVRDDSGNVQLGANTAIVSMNPQATAGYMEFSGAGLSAIAVAMDRKESQMAALGSRVLTPEKKGVEAAETARIHRASEYASLLSIALTLNEALDWGLRWHARFGQVDTDVDPDEIYCRVNKDFYPDVFNPSEFQVLFQALQSGTITYEAFFRRLQRWGIYDEDEKAEEVKEQADIEAEMKPQSFTGGGFGGGGGFQ